LRIDRLLDGVGVVGDAVADGAELLRRRAVRDDGRLGSVSRGRVGGESGGPERGDGGRTEDASSAD
jgi:hypothetical protein